MEVVRRLVPRVGGKLYKRFVPSVGESYQSDIYTWIRITWKSFLYVLHQKILNLVSNGTPHDYLIFIYSYIFKLFKSIFNIIVISIPMSNKLKQIEIGNISFFFIFFFTWINIHLAELWISYSIVYHRFFLGEKKQHF